MSSTNRASDSPSKTVEQEVLQIAAAIQNGSDVNGIAGDAVDDSPWRANEFSIFLNPISASSETRRPRSGILVNVLAESSSSVRILTAAVSFLAPFRFDQPSQPSLGCRRFRLSLTHRIPPNTRRRRGSDGARLSTRVYFRRRRIARWTLATVCMKPPAAVNRSAAAVPMCSRARRSFPRASK
jgi:hypothetical protein